jgi:hydrolase, P-loop family
MQITVKNVTELAEVAQYLAENLPTKFCLELIGDVGAGKTTLTKALVEKLGSNDEVTSPSFAINNRYQLSDGREVSHYDFYRLGEAGVMSQELLEDLVNPQTCVIVEWAETVSQVLPAERLQMTITTLADGGRRLELVGFDTGNMNMEQN